MILHSCNKQTGSDDEDLEFYVRECGKILGVSKQLSEDRRTAKDILQMVFSRIAEYKKASQVCINNFHPLLFDHFSKPIFGVSLGGTSRK